MKKLLLTAVMALAATGAFAQSKTTGAVTLTTGMTAKIDLNNDTSTATLTLTGPQDRWIALQFGSFASGGGMQSGTDVVYFNNGTGLVDAHQNGIGSTPSTDTNDWTTTSNTVSGTTRTIVATRAFAGGTNDFTFNYDDANIDFAWARGSSASYTLANHGSNRGYQLNKAFSCMPPDAPAAVAQAFCAGATVAELTATGTTGATFSWYAAATGGTALAATTALTQTTYYVSQTAGACESARTPVVITVTTVPQPSASTAQTVCAGASIANLTATGQAGATVNWYESATATTPIASTTGIGAGTLYVGQTQGDCSSTRLAVTITINNPAQPGGPAAQTFCEGAVVTNLQATGTALQWFNVINGFALEGSTVLQTGTYYVTQTIGACNSEYKQVNVTINEIPGQPAATAAQTYVAGETVSDLEITVVIGATVKWYTLSGTVYTEIPSTTALVNGTTYYVTQTLNTCESDYSPITANISAGTESFSLAGLKAYPNPVSNVVTLSANTSLAGVTVHNILGQQVLAQKASGTTTQVDMAGLTAGTYLVKVSGENGATVTVRVLKQ